MIETFNALIGAGFILVLALLGFAVILIVLGETRTRAYRLIRKNAVLLAFLLMLAEVLGSLVYSEFFHLPPCTFCWWQRIFIYPQVIVLGLALWRKSRGIVSSWSDTWLPSIIMSAIGACFSLYHILIQSGVVGPTGACLISGVSCAKIDVLIFGWITLPIMGLSMFLGVLVLASMNRARRE